MAISSSWFQPYLLLNQWGYELELINYTVNRNYLDGEIQHKAVRIFRRQLIEKWTPRWKFYHFRKPRWCLQQPRTSIQFINIWIVAANNSLHPTTFDFQFINIGMPVCINLQPTTFSIIIWNNVSLHQPTSYNIQFINWLIDNEWWSTEVCWNKTVPQEQR